MPLECDHPCGSRTGTDAPSGRSRMIPAIAIRTATGLFPPAYVTAELKPRGAERSCDNRTARPGPRLLPLISAMSVGLLLAGCAYAPRPAPRIYYPTYSRVHHRPPSLARAVTPRDKGVCPVSHTNLSETEKERLFRQFDNWEIDHSPASGPHGGGGGQSQASSGEP
jgi:hypothetical protein